MRFLHLLTTLAMIGAAAPALSAQASYPSLSFSFERIENGSIRYSDSFDPRHRAEYFQSLTDTEAKTIHDRFSALQERLRPALNEMHRRVMERNRDTTPKWAADKAFYPHLWVQIFQSKGKNEHISVRVVTWGYGDHIPTQMLPWPTITLKESDTETSLLSLIDFDGIEAAALQSIQEFQEKYGSKKAQ